MRRRRKWTVNLVTKREVTTVRFPLSSSMRVNPVLPLQFNRIGSVEGHSWQEAQRRALRKYGHLPRNRTESIWVSVQPYEPTAWERILADPTDSSGRTSS
jgi:hypothetical protein